jgi:hypothetical protein
VPRIQEIVPLLGDDGGRDQEDGAPPREGPPRAQVGQSLRRRECSPVRGKGGKPEVGPGDIVRDVGRDRDEIGRSVGELDVDEVLQRRQGKRAGRVDDGDAAVVPASAGKASTLAVEGGVSLAAEPPDPGQL